MIAIELRGLSKCYGQVNVLRRVDLQIAAGTRLALVGPSGAGKSTLLRIMAGLEESDAGQVLIDDQEVLRLRPERRGIALMSQDYALYPHMTVRRNLEAALLSLKLPRDQVTARCQECLHWFGIEQLATRLPGELSGGQAQRVALAKAVIRRPRLLLLDEPFSQLDGPLRDELRELLKQVVEHYQTTLVFVTHDALDALRLATHIAILHAGSVEQIGTPREVYRRPKSQAAAELLSPWGVNWLPGSAGLQPTWEAVNGRSEGSFPVVKAIGFRPESARLSTVAPNQTNCRGGMSGADAATWPADAESWCIAAVVEQVVFVGHGYLLYLKAAETSYRCLSHEPLEPGTAAWLQVQRSQSVQVVGSSH